MDHLQAIRMFARVVETGGFAKAAQSLQVPNATVSKWVKALEAQLGVTLLERSTRRVNVTTDGAAYYEATRHLLSELDDIESTLGRARSNPRGTLRVDTGGSTASGILVPALPGFLARYPDIQVQLSVTDRVVDLVADNIDCAIRSTADDPDLVTRPVGQLAWTTCGSPAFLAQHGTPQHPRDIAARRMPVVGYFPTTSGGVQPLQFAQDDARITLDNLRNDVLVSDSNAHVAAALAGLGLIHTMDFMVRPAIEQGLLAAVLADWRPAPLDVYIAYPPSRRYSTKVRVFVDWVGTLFPALKTARS